MSEPNTMLGVLENERIFSVEVSQDKLTATFTEACDWYFEVVLTKANMGTLIEERKAIHKGMA